MPRVIQSESGQTFPSRRVVEEGEEGEKGVEGEEGEENASLRHKD
jgi:hypothetical protein